jgi:hypothetical protein
LVSPGIPDRVSPSDGAHIGIVPQAVGFAPEQIITTLGGKMKCGLGMCGCGSGTRAALSQSGSALQRASRRISAQP